MSYAAQQDLIDRFGEEEFNRLADRDNDGQEDSAVVTAVIVDTDALIDSYLGRRYKLPLQNSYPLLTAVAADIIRYKLHDDKPTDEVRKRYENQLKLLEKLARGEVRFSGEEDAGADVSPGAPDYSAGSGEFTDLEGF